PDAAISLFDETAPATPDQMIGRWRGHEVKTGHPMEGMLSAAYWHGKEFRDDETVFPLVHNVPVWGEMRLNPARLPIDLVTALPARDRLLPLVFPVLAPFFRTTRPRARLRCVTFRERTHAAMIYDGLPIIDYFACLAPDVRLGWMQRRGDDQPFFFRLTREPSPR
ncbi:MAG: GXWXG domain-containing protein, partial [Pseudomonadota bacterium]